MNEWYNKHYITINENGRIIDGFSDAFQQPASGDICINEQGKTQFCLFPDGEENPSLVDPDGIHLYTWDGKAVRETTQGEREAEKAEMEASAPMPVPSPTDILGQQVTALTLSNMQKDQMINAMGAQLAQMSLDMIALKSSSGL